MNAMESRDEQEYHGDLKNSQPRKGSLDRVFPRGSAGKESACKAGDLGSIPELGRSPEEGNGKPLQYSSLENPMDRDTAQEVTKNQT